MAQMSDLDRELSDAVSDAEARSRELAETDALDPHRGAGPLVFDSEVVAPATGPARGFSKSYGGWGLLLALLAMGGGVLALVLSSAETSVIYSVTTSQLLGDTAAYQGKNVRVQGALVKGSLRHRAEPCEYRFSITEGKKTLPVRYPECVVPDTFRDVPDVDVEVTAEGRLTEEGYFAADQIMAKCPSKYEMKQKAGRGEAAPHQAVGGPGPLPTFE